MRARRGRIREGCGKNDGQGMAKPLDPKEIVTTDEIGITNRVEISAVIELLMEKRIITQDELIEKCKKMRGKIRGK